jgi:hypothetical protein
MREFVCNACNNQTGCIITVPRNAVPGYCPVGHGRVPNWHVSREEPEGPERVLMFASEESSIPALLHYQYKQGAFDLVVVAGAEYFETPRPAPAQLWNRLLREVRFVDSRRQQWRLEHDIHGLWRVPV